ncbi:MAG: EF-hand domain-containing protein [Gammaproteobacteria bacterium]|nr:EF-hand domain-containing protein [Gammaproteobacteria bacterium]
MRRFATFAGGLTSALFALSCTAQDMPAFGDLDADQDGMISAAEAGGHQGLSDQFGIVDADQNGAISIEEYEAFVKG